MVIGISAGLGGGGERTGSSYTGNSYLGCAGGGLPPKSGGTLIRGSGMEGTIGGSVGLGYYGCIGCDVGPVIFFLTPALPCSFLSRTGQTIL